MADPVPRLTFGELANRVLATDDAEEREQLIAQLAAGTRSEEQIFAISDRLLTEPGKGERIFLEWIARVRGKVPDSVVARITPQLSNRKIPAAVRVAAVACVLRALPDRVEVVKRAVRPLLAGLSPLRRLERLHQLQHQMDRSRGLDLLIERRERRVKMDCPRCGVRLPRIEMIKHLWHEHGLLLEGGKTRGPVRTVEDLRRQHGETRDTTVLDRAGLIAGPAGLREWVAATDTSSEDMSPLLAAAKENRAGLCPVCLAEIPQPLSPVPPPLNLAGSRLSGDGCLVEIKGTDWFRTRLVSTPEQVMAAGSEGGRMLGPRGIATLVSAAVLLLALVAVAALPASIIAPFTLAFRMVLIAAIAYGLVYGLSKPLPTTERRLIDSAWEVLASRIVRQAAPSPGAVRFLTRLCRTSVGRGDPEERAGDLARMIEWSQARAGDTEAAIQLLAAASVLQIEDGAIHGRDRIAGFAALAAAAFRGERPIEFAEYVAECVPALEAGERGRLRILLIAAAFDAGLNPRNLVDLWAVAPNLRRTMAVEPLHRVGLLHGVWLMEKWRRWERVAPADSVFELCRTAPNRSGRLLLRFPDLLLRAGEPGSDEFEILVCARGVEIGGVLLADPDSDVEIVRSARRGYTLVFGPHRLHLDSRPAQDFAATIRGWLLFRATSLLPYIDNYLAPGPGEVTDRVLRPFVRRCARCGTASAVAAGKIGKVIG